MACRTGLCSVALVVLVAGPLVACYSAPPPLHPDHPAAGLTSRRAANLAVALHAREDARAREPVVRADIELACEHLARIKAEGDAEETRQREAGTLADPASVARLADLRRRADDAARYLEERRATLAELEATIAAGDAAVRDLVR